MMSALVRLPNKEERFIDFQVDTGATHTLIAEREFPRGMLRKCGFDAKPITTLMGAVKGFVIPHATLYLHDDNGNRHLINDITPHFLARTPTTCMQRYFLKRVFGQPFPKLLEAPRSLLGRDVLDRFTMMSKKGAFVILTDQSQKIRAFVKDKLHIDPDNPWA